MEICLGLIFILYDVRASFSFSFIAAWYLIFYKKNSTFLFSASLFRYGRRICEGERVGDTFIFRIILILHTMKKNSSRDSNLFSESSFVILILQVNLKYLGRVVFNTNGGN